MGLTCDCDIDYDPEPGDWYWFNEAKDYAPLPFKRSKKCCSCDEKIKPGDLAVEHLRRKCPEYEVEIDIYGEDGHVPIASDWMCESCGDLWFSITELGYCMSPRDDMRELVKEYAREHNTHQQEGDL